MSKYGWKNEIDRVFNGRTNLLPEVFPSEVPLDIFSWLKSEVKKAKEKNIDARKGLIGHINEEYNIVKSDNANFIEYENFIKRCAFNKYYDSFWDKTDILTEGCDLKIQQTWVNFQKKYEFNPPHNHSGVFSWIIFLNIPYNLEDEDRVFPEVSTNTKGDFRQPSTSRLCFSQISPTEKGGIDHIVFNVDKSFEGKILMFPSYMQHQVFPFYTSDDYRITISGNSFFDVNKSTS